MEIGSGILETMKDERRTMADSGQPMMAAAVEDRAQLCSATEAWKRMLAACTILQGDCREVLRGIPDGAVDLVVTDPPYGIDYQSNRVPGKRSAKIPGDETTEEVIALLEQTGRELKRVLRPGGHLYLFCAPLQIGNILATLLHQFRLLDVLCYVTGRGMGDKTGGKHVRGWDAVLRFAPLFPPINGGKKQSGLPSGATEPRKLIGNPDDVLWAGRSKQRLHPTMKDVYVLEQLIARSSLPGEVVLDCFAGSGSLGVAGLGMSEPRKVILIERDAEYVERMRKRLAVYGPVDRLPNDERGTREDSGQPGTAAAAEEAARRPEDRAQLCGATGNAHSLYALSPQLRVIVPGKKPLTRPQVTKKLWDYVKARGLNNGRFVECDDALLAVFIKREVSLFELQSLVQLHLTDTGQRKESAQMKRGGHGA